MIGRISRFMTRFVSRWLPDPLIFAMLLTLLTFVIALWLTPQTPINMVKMWGDGFWNLLAFGMQMALIIVTGHALASSAPVKSLLRTAASAAKTPVQGVMLVTFFGSVACVINWGFGLVVGAMFAREVARRVPGSDYPLLIACAYIGFLTRAAASLAQCLCWLPHRATRLSISPGLSRWAILCSVVLTFSSLWH